jgi:hypothetical protein
MNCVLIGFTREKRDFRGEKQWINGVCGYDRREIECCDSEQFFPDCTSCSMIDDGQPVPALLVVQ